MKQEQKFQFIQDFKDFALKGNVVDLAVWVIIGTAFWKIVSSLVGDVVMPLLSALLRAVNLSTLSYSIPSISGNPNEAIVVSYGKFLQASLDFLIISIVVFLFVSLLSRALKKPMNEKKKPDDVVLLGEIRDLLVQKVKSDHLDDTSSKIWEKKGSKEKGKVKIPSKR